MSESEEKSDQAFFFLESPRFLSITLSTTITNSIFKKDFLALQAIQQ